MTGSSLVSALTFASLGIIVWATAVVIILRVLPGDLWREVMDRGNVSAAIVVGALMVGLAMIISAAVH